ncbi:MAG TPA: glycoside hydrolase family 97 N-terminal domain-containing protein [Bryobacteraceae bacterium]|jgi:alpha-glucosidase
MTLQNLRTAGLLCISALAWAANDANVASPDGKVVFRLGADENGSLVYAVSFGGKAVIEPSAIGIIVDGVPLSRGADLGAASAYTVDTTYPWNGPHSTAIDKCNGVRVPVTHRQSRTAFTLDIRAYNDGVAFRHVAPGEGTRVPDEATSFRPPDGATLWYHDFENHYEGNYVRKGLRAVAPGEWLAPPMTFQLPQNAGYAAITEGSLRHYSGMGLQADGSGVLHARLGHAIPASYPFRLRYAQDVERLSKPATITGTITTPWRVILVGADLNALVNSDVIHNVADPPDPKLFPDGIRTSWIHTGRALWSYLDGGNNTLEGMKEWARMAHDLGFQYNLLEGFWSRWPEAQLKELAEYSRGLGVSVIIWKHSNQLRTPESRKEFFELCRRNGIAGAKIDFFDHEHKELIDLYEALLRGAAENHLVIDFHGCNKPTGLERTYPNLIGFEGVHGMEGRAPWAQHEVTLPFTRMLAGLADYTPMHFSGAKLADTTWPHQVANAVLLQAPLLAFAAHPANILGNPMRDVIQSIPTTWDQTIALPVSQIGDVAAFARRKGDTWILAVNNGPVGKTVRVDLSFLGQGSYQATLLRDAADAEDVKIEHLTARATDALYVKMRSGGGFVGRFVK